MKTNKKSMDRRFDPTAEKLAGGKGGHAAKQSPEALLRRAVMSCLLWEDMAYLKGSDAAANIAELVKQVPLSVAADLAIEARTVQKLRHVPLLIAREMARHPRLKEAPSYVSTTLYEIIHRPDEITEFLSLYWKDGKQPLSAQVKLGLAAAFSKFDEYRLSKYDRDDVVKLRDALFLVHGYPQDKLTGYTKEVRRTPGTLPNPGAEMFQRLVDRKLAPANTWEERLSAGENKKDVFEDMIINNQLGALAFLRNLRNMVEAGVRKDVIQHGFSQLQPKWLLPINYYAAAQAAPQYEREIEDLMLRGFAEVTKLPGHSVFVVDISGSMGSGISGKSQFSRMDVACVMAMVAESTCESLSLYATAGDDHAGKHKTALVTSHNGILRGSGFGLIEKIKGMYRSLGGGGIFTRQALEYIQAQEADTPARIIIFSDSQDCDRVNKVPKPFGEHNYIVDVSANQRGVNYEGLWDAEISGWSDHFIDYIAALEGLDWSQGDEPDIPTSLTLAED